MQVRLSENPSSFVIVARKEPVTKIEIRYSNAASNIYINCPRLISFTFIRIPHRSAKDTDEIMKSLQCFRYSEDRLAVASLNCIYQIKKSLPFNLHNASTKKKSP